mmetsp:Transcript_8271/g.13837  ORF Transcript_8271/g.13837 Transcript_8271/m.13837 type:complete len:92 (+) Transcript_8271:1145-1420(+)
MSDTYKIYKILNVTNVIMIIFTGFEIYRIQCFDIAESIDWMYDVAFIIVQGIYCSTFMLNMTILALICSENTRATMFSINSIFGSFAILFI